MSNAERSLGSGGTQPSIASICYVRPIEDDFTVKNKSMQARVEDGLGPSSNSSEYGEKYLELLYANWAQITSTLRRTATLLVVLIVGFLLLRHAKNTGFTLGPLRLTNIASVLILVPAVVSFLGYEFVALQTVQNRFYEVSDAIVRMLHESVWDNDLEVLLEPPTASLWGENGWFDLRVSEPGRISRLLELSVPIIGYSLLIGALAFLVYAYLTLYQNDHANTVAVTVSAVFAAFNCLRAVLIYADSNL